MADADTTASPPTPLRRVLGLWVLVLYGLGMIIGAGIYVLVGEVAGVSGWGTPAAFMLSAALAALTGLAYAELVGRVPEAAGEVAYAQAAFGRRWLSAATGLAIVAVALAAAASISSAAAGYFRVVIPPAADLPPWAPGAVLIIAFTVIASLGVRQGAWVAAGLSALEIGGLLVIIGLGADSLGEIGRHADKLLTLEPFGPVGLLAGAYVAFFAYLGFENLANMAEETRNPGRTVAVAIILAIVISAFLYALVALVSLLAVGPEGLAASKAPLCLVIERAGYNCGSNFAILALIALSNGILVEIMLVARLLYGMGRRGLIPVWFAAVNPRTKVPVRGTVIAGAAILVLTMGVPFEWLVRATSGVLLVVFIVVNASLWQLQRSAPLASSRTDLFRVPRFLPPLAAALSLGLLAVAIVGAVT